jgi:Icc-related predicted phosphoesterase
MRILVVGDVHGNTVFMRSAIERASVRGINTILQVGDFGYWPHTKSGENFLKDLERFAAERNVTVWWIDGNHENHEWLGLKHRSEDGTVKISEHCRYLPRGHRWEWNGVHFGALGGAFSIDWRARVPMVSWWPQEVVHLRDVDRLGSDPLDVLVTHDHPAGFDLPTDFSLRPADQAVSDEQRLLLREALDQTNPSLLLHGHWHHRHTTQLRRENAPTVLVEGLGCDSDGEDAFLELDLAHLIK